MSQDTFKNCTKEQHEQACFIVKEAKYIWGKAWSHISSHQRTEAVAHQIIRVLLSIPDSSASDQIKELKSVARECYYLANGEREGETQ